MIDAYEAFAKRTMVTKAQGKMIGIMSASIANRTPPRSIRRP